MPRTFLAASMGLFIVSSLFPLAASLLRADRLPVWAGVADVALAAGLAASALVIVTRKPGDFAPVVVATAFRAYRTLSGTFLLLLVVFFVLGDRLRWDVLLPGLAWRAWVLVMVVPSWVSLWQTRARTPADGGEEG